MDTLILKTAFVLGWLVLVALCLLALWCCLRLIWIIVRDGITIKLLREAAREHRKLHPEKWKVFDTMNGTDE